MKEHKTLALAMISLFLFSGCLGAVEPGVEVPSIELPEDWSTTVQRTVSNPQLSQFSDCEELERALKISIEEEARTQILQAIEEQYFYGGMWMEDDMAMAESADGGTGTSSQPAQTRRVEGSDYSGTKTKNRASMKLISSKLTATISTSSTDAISLSSQFLNLVN